MTKEEKKFIRREWRVRSAGDAVTSLLSAYGGKEARHLAALWENWNMVMGEGIACLGFPLGHKEHTLTIGAEDSMALQELSMQSVEILERANAFMDSIFFKQIKVILMQGQRALTQQRPRRPSHYIKPPNPPRPPRLGSLLGKLDPNSPVTQCYKAYLALYNV